MFQMQTLAQETDMYGDRPKDSVAPQVAPREFAKLMIRAADSTTLPRHLRPLSRKAMKGSFCMCRLAVAIPCSQYLKQIYLLH